MVAPVDSQAAAFQVGAVKPLFEVRPRVITFQGFIGYSYDVSSDGQRFLVNTIVEESSADLLTMIVNWPSLLAR